MTSSPTVDRPVQSAGRSQRHRLRPVAFATVLAATLAWMTMVRLAGGGHWLDHHVLGRAVARSQSAAEPLLVDSGPSLPAAMGIVLLGWLVMVVAMMLPPALPMLTVLERLLARHRRRAWPLVAGVSAFLGVWLLVGAALVLADAALHAAAAGTPWLLQHPTVVPGVVVIGAGLYQFSTLKQACLRACRSPRGFAVAHWRGRRPVAVEAATVTATYALSCVGCCWALMTVSFATGAAMLPVMVLLAAAMAAERLAPGGRRLVKPLGAALILLGTALLLGLVPAALPVT